MFNPVIASDLFTQLCEQQQELLVGGVDLQQDGSDFTQKSSVQNMTNTTGPLGNISRTNTTNADITGNAKSLLATNTGGFPPLGSLNNTPMFGGFA